MNKLFFLALVILVPGYFLTGCKKDKGDPPVLPPPESMIIDFSNFVSLKKGAAMPAGQKGTDDSSWEFAASVARVWSSMVTSTLAIPIASYTDSGNQTPVYLSQDNWQWSYDFTVTNLTYKARLTGVIGTSDVKWKMYISKEGTGGFSEFLWMEGTSKPDGTEGKWVLNESPKSPAAMLQINWTKTGTTIGFIKYTYVKNDNFKNSYIDYGNTTSTQYDKYYKISYATVSGTYIADVEWNTTSQNGRVKCLNYLGDTLWYCWDSNNLNIVCL
jgi:hypothetical protein